MAKKNEILLSIAMEGDAEVKSKLKAVGEEGKRSLADIEKQVGRAGGAVDKFREPLGGLQKALAPLSEASGLAGFSGLSGMFSRIAVGMASPAGLVGVAAAALLGMAKLGEETQRQKGRLDSLGDAGGFDKLTDQAKRLGTNVSDLQPRYEKFLAFQQKMNANNPSVIHPPARGRPDGTLIPNSGFEPGAQEESANGVQIFGGTQTRTPPSRSSFQAFDRALFELIRKDIGDAGQAHKVAGDFQSGLFQSGNLTGDQLRSLQQTSPSAANFLTGSLSQKLGRGFSNPSELANLLDRGGAHVSSTDLINEGARHAPEAAARGVTEAFGALEAASKRLAESFGGDHARLGNVIDKGAQLVDQGATRVDEFRNAADNRPGGNNFIGPVRPEDISTAPKSVGEVFSSDKGDLLGRIVGFMRAGGSGAGNGFGGVNPFAAISDFLSKALTNPGALQEKQRPAEVPNPLSPQPQSQPATTPQSSVFDSFIENLNAKLNGLNPQGLKVDAPSSTLSIRGDVEQVRDALKELAPAISEAVSGIRGSSAGKGQSVQALADGGPIRRLDGGGHISGPGTSTSDSIPAMLSDKEYVIKAASARKIGRAGLDWINAGMPGYADGGNVSITKLGAGNHQVSYDPATGGAIVDGVHRRPGDPLLNDPFVQQAIRRSKADAAAAGEDSGRTHNSDFVGIFGGHVFDQAGSYAKGGAVGNVISRYFGGGRISIPGFAMGGDIGGLSPVPAVSGLSGGGGDSLAGHMSVDLRTNHGDFHMMAPEDTAKQLGAAARDAALFQTGPAPSWAYGR